MPRPIVIPMSAKIAIYNLYKVDGLRAQEIADRYHCSVQHVLRIIRKIEGKPVYTKKPSMSYGDKYNRRNKLFEFQKPMRDVEEK
jgi:Mor family transcriptional regulator